MKFAVVFACVALLSSARAVEVSPIEKVIELLGGLETKVIEEGKAALKAYDEYSEWCEDRSKNLGFEIKTGEAEVAELTASIEKETASITALNTKIEELAGDIAADEADLKAATMIREKEATDFAAEEKELLEIIDMLERAIAILKREMAKGGSALLQTKGVSAIAQALDSLVQASELSSADASKLVALVQNSRQDPAEEDDDEADTGAPAAAVYKGHSGSIIDTLEDLLDKAEAQLEEARKEETNKIHNYEMLKQSITDEVTFANKDMAAAKTSLAESTEHKSAAEGDLAVTSKDLAADKKTKETLHHDCMTAAEDFEAETKSRDEELKALAEAKKVLKENTGGAAEITYGFSQVSFLQLSRTKVSTSADLANFEAIRLVRDLAQKQHSTALAFLARQLSEATRAGAVSGQDPFAKVKGLISDMISKLEEEAAADATQKAYCDKETAESTAKKEEKAAEVAKLTTKIDQASARSAQLKEEIATLQKELANIHAAQAEMDSMRAEQKEAYDKNKADMEQGLEGVKMALKVLNEYYAKEDKAHEAAEGAGSSIIGLLEVVESDFTKGLAEIVATEEAAVADYEKDTKANEIEVAAKEQDVKYKTKEAAGLDKAVAEDSAERANVQQELDAVLEYLEKLNEMCVAKPETYAERKARREAEIAGLKQALTILEGGAMLLQRSAAHALRGAVHH